MRVYPIVLSSLTYHCHLQIAQGMADPGIASMAKLEQVLKGIKVHQAKSIQEDGHAYQLHPKS